LKSEVTKADSFKPTSMAIWTSIRRFFTARIEKMGVGECYFPLFISEKSLSTEKEHLEGFEAEVAWVTMGYVGDCCFSVFC
jgi:prolyl-tRNA synthetase